MQNRIKNRKTGVVYTSDSRGKLQSLPKQGMFKQNNQEVDTSLANELIDNIMSNLPDHINQDDVRNIRRDLQQHCQAAFKERGGLIKSIEKDADSGSVMDFIKSISGWLLLGTQITAGAAQTSGLTANIGIPSGGYDLCEAATNDSLLQCIQGYITQLGQSWAPNMPQFARVFQSATNSTACITASELQAMMLSAFDSPQGAAGNCTLSADVIGQNSVSVMATMFDELSCQLLKHGKKGFDTVVNQCNTLPSNALYYGLGFGLGIPALVALAVILCACCRRGCCNRNGYGAL